MYHYATRCLRLRQKWWNNAATEMKWFFSLICAIKMTIKMLLTLCIREAFFSGVIIDVTVL